MNIVIDGVCHHLNVCMGSEEGVVSEYILALCTFPNIIVGTRFLCSIAFEYSEWGGGGYIFIYISQNNSNHT